MKLYIKPLGTGGTNCYILADDDGKCVIFDPAAQPEKLIAFISEHNLDPACILLTHGHYDHIGAVNPLIKQYGCQLGIGENDAEQLSDRSKSLANIRLLPDELCYMTPDMLLKEGDVVPVGQLQITVIDTPGHTRGGVSYLFENILFSGDTLFAGNVGRTDLYGGDYKTLLASLKKLAALPGDYRVLPGHGPETSLDRERQYNPYMKEQADENIY